MNQLINKYKSANDIIISFDIAIIQYQKWKTSVNPQQTLSLGIDYDRILHGLQDSSIQRLKYSIDILWKYLKTYLELKYNIMSTIPAPSNIIREASKRAIINEKDAEIMLEMIKARNMTSHIYQEEIAQILTKSLPTYRDAMQRIISNLKP